MAKSNKSYRIRTKVGQEADTFLDVHLDQDYDSLEILSLKLSDKDTYKLHNSDYGVVVGRVLANGNFGVPNAKISVFIQADEQNSDMKMWNLYPYTSTSTRNDDDIRYNLLPDESVKDCHKAVGTFPHKTYLLENDSLLEVFDKYYVYTTRTNAAGDYLICGVPTGMQTIHMDLDLSDCGILSQRPRDFVYKGYTIEQFENPNQFKKDENLDSLAQIFSQNQPVYVQPFWGNEDNGETIGITRADIEISFKFEPTCVFMGSAISDNASNGVGKKCVPTNQMGTMDELTAGEGTIEMIRKTQNGNVEEFSIKGNQLINGNGVWCYQIPMNLDYMMTDEYGNMVPTDDPEKGIPTRTRVRFRASLTDMEESSQSYYRAKYLIPNNPSVDDGEDKIDYNFGTYTNEDSYRDLFWNGVYTVKSYIPRFQKSKRWKNERFSGIKACNYYGGNNPMPYNNLRIKLPFMFTVLCIFVKLFIKIVSLVNRIEAGIVKAIILLVELLLEVFLRPLVAAVDPFNWFHLHEKLDNLIFDVINDIVTKLGLHCSFIGDGLCPDMEGWYFAPGCASGIDSRYSSAKDKLMHNTLEAAVGGGDDIGGSDSKPKDVMSSGEFNDETSLDNQNITTSEQKTACLTTDIDYLLNCFEMNLAQEYRVIKFDFYNDWVNGVLYFPRWMRKIKRKKRYKFSLSAGITTYYEDRVQGCMNSENSNVKKSRYYTQQCSLAVDGSRPNEPWTEIKTSISCSDIQKDTTDKTLGIFPARCHKKDGMSQTPIFGNKSGLVTERTTMLGQYVYYLKPCEWQNTTNGYQRILLFATDIVLLGTLNDCDENGIPQAFKYLNNSSYVMPTNLALTTMDDDAYIYAAGNGTVCLSKGTIPSGAVESNVVRVNPGYESTYKAYSNTESDKIEYGEYDDPIPVTESAGINWNYSGPGQEDVPGDSPESPSDLLKRLFNSGNKRYQYLYYPGGHFLGLSCINSETNIKSCVNLKRICELGATMSQRREEVRSYNEENGKAKYRYYVPTGLISNVDIEGAAFRSMFATLNYNKLVANEKNEQTGYKKYAFRFLRPDGFDGSLTNYVHRVESPYNAKVNTGSEKNYPVKYAGNFFRSLFANWSEPLDYDDEEIEYTERRTIEDGISDYHMFRFGLDNFSTEEQRKHYLGYIKDSYLLPQYENSFYFYFGLKDGATALDEFKKQFFSECGSNNIMGSPQIYVKETITEENESCDEELNIGADLIIDNMLPAFTVVLKNEATGEETNPYTTDDENVPLSVVTCTADFEVSIGYKYTVKVTDSIGQTSEVSFTFGASAVKTLAETVHFRIKSPGKPTNVASKGGYVRINDNVTILKVSHSITQTGDCVSIDSIMIYKVGADGQEQGPLDKGPEPGKYSVSSYTDASNEVWVLYYLPEKGTYNFYIYYKGQKIPIYTTTIDDNSKINLYVSCDYLAYKPEPNAYIEGDFCHYCWSKKGIDSGNTAGLRSINDNDWHNGAPFSSTTIPEEWNLLDWQKWLMRHTFYRQSPNDALAYNNLVYSKGNTEIAIFGEPEFGDLVNGGGIFDNASSGGTFYRNDTSYFLGVDAGDVHTNDYYLDSTYSYYPSMFWDGEEENEYVINETTSGRNLFDFMSYTDDGRAAADALDENNYITTYKYGDDDDTTKVKLTGIFTSTALSYGHGCIVVFENGAKLFAVRKEDETQGEGNDSVTVGVLEGHYSYNIYPDADGVSEELLKMATIYPTLHLPTIYKPMYGAVSAATWNLYGLQIVQSEDGRSVLKKVLLPTSYKIEGTIFNGLTYSGTTSRFYSGVTAQEGSEQTYETYAIFNTKDGFWSGLTTNFSGDIEPKRALTFGITQDSTSNDMFDYFGREISATTDEKDFSEIKYVVKEAVPAIPSYVSGTVFTERYNSGSFDQTVLADTCDLSDKFINTLKIKVLDTEKGITGYCSLYTDESLPESTIYYITKEQLFERGANPLMITDGDDDSVKYCYGTYNEHAQYNIKGATTLVTRKNNKFNYTIKQENGSEVNRTAVNETELNESGITLLHGYILSGTYKNNIVQEIADVLSADTAVTYQIYNPFDTEAKNYISTKDRAAYQLEDSGDCYNAIIAIYEKPDDGTKNKMLVYKLYPYGMLDAMFPPQQEGIDPYIKVSPTGVSVSSDEQDITFTGIETNTSYTATTGTGSTWITITQTGDTSLTFHVDENTGDERTGTIILTSTEDTGATANIKVKQDAPESENNELDSNDAD